MLDSANQQSAARAFTTTSRAAEAEKFFLTTMTCWNSFAGENGQPQFYISNRMSCLAPAEGGYGYAKFWLIPWVIN